MLSIGLIHNNTSFVKERLAIKNFKNLAIIDDVLLIDNQRKKLQFEIDETQSKLNTVSKEIGILMSKGDKNFAEEKKILVAELKQTLQPLQTKLLNAEQEIHDKLITVPNLPHISVPKGTSPEHNEIVREGGKIPELQDGAMPHWDLAKKYDLINFELGNKITGSGFPVYKAKGAKLQRALIQYFLNFNTNAGYTEYQPPLMVNEASAFGTGQLPDKEGQMYFAKEDAFYLIPTSEVPLTNIYRDEILKEKELPVKMTAYTPCFRREAGSYGKDVRGLNRLHQFDKVEIVQLAHPDNSYAILEEMVSHVEFILKSLQLPYRILRLCGGDMSFTSALTYDFEVFSAAQKKWLEVSSCSNFETFQSNRMKIRFKDESNKIQLVHTLNGSSLALPRIVACLLENNQGSDAIMLPEVLHSYFGDKTIS